MDYKYIEQLLERYWACESSEAEERILREFFAQQEIPAHLARYRSLFEYERTAAADGLDAAFDARVCAIVEAAPQPVVKMKRMTMARRLRPFYRAAAAVAIVMLLGNAAQHSFKQGETSEGWDYNMAGYTDTYENPQTALDESLEALKMVQDGLKTAAVADSAQCEPMVMDAKAAVE